MMCQPKQKELMSDYDRSITKSWEKKSNRRYYQVPQLGEQPKQRVPDLKVLSKEDEALAEFVAETGLSKAQLQGKGKHPVHEGAGRKPFVLGQPLMWPELIERLPTRMHELNQWYLKACAEGYIMLAAQIKHTHFYRGMDDIWINVDHFLFLCHQDTLDKSFISV